MIKYSGEKKIVQKKDTVIFTMGMNKQGKPKRKKVSAALRRFMSLGDTYFSKMPQCSWNNGDPSW